MNIPQTFEQWKSCIVHDCKIQLTKDFALQRLQVYTNHKVKKHKSLLPYMAIIIYKT